MMSRQWSLLPNAKRANPAEYKGQGGENEMLLLVYLLFVFKQNRRNRSIETEKPQQRKKR
jgi:hypothetical protein